MDQFSTFLPCIFLAYSAFMLSITSPGPNVLAILDTSMSVGRPVGLSRAMVVAAASFVWALLTTTFAFVIATTDRSIVVPMLHTLTVSTPPVVWLCDNAHRWIQGTLDVYFALAGVRLLSSRT